MQWPHLVSYPQTLQYICSYSASVSVLQTIKEKCIKLLSIIPLYLLDWKKMQDVYICVFVFVGSIAQCW